MRTSCTTVLVLAIVLSASGATWADFDDGIAAFKADDYERAWKNWKPLAERGDRDAQLGLGSLYEKGRGVDQDLAEAHKWYVLAWQRSVVGAKRRAVALRSKLSPEVLADSKERIQAWKAAFETRTVPPETTARGRVDAFRVGADAHTQAHPDNARLKILCSARVKSAHVTFVTADGRRVLLVAVTPHALRDPAKDISLDVMIVDRRRHRGSPTATMDWAYVYDRNGDDYVDYFTYLDGPNAIIPDPRPKVLPSMTGGIMTGEQMLFLRRHVRMLFWHSADDNYDGVADAYVVGTRDDASGWIDGHIVVRSTSFDGQFDECRYVPGARGTAPASCRGMEHGYGVPGHSLTGLLRVPPGRDYELFQTINAGARQCGLTSRHFRAE